MAKTMTCTSIRVEAWLRLGIACLLAHAAPAWGAQPSDLASPFFGVDGGGNTVPGASVPFGFVSLSPDTSHGSTSGYDFERPDPRLQRDPCQRHRRRWQVRQFPRDACDGRRRVGQSRLPQGRRGGQPRLLCGDGWRSRQANPRRADGEPPWRVPPVQLSGDRGGAGDPRRECDAGAWRWRATQQRRTGHGNRRSASFRKHDVRGRLGRASSVHAVLLCGVRSARGRSRSLAVPPRRLHPHLGRGDFRGRRYSEQPRQSAWRLCDL